MCRRVIQVGGNLICQPPRVALGELRRPVGGGRNKLNRVDLRPKSDSPQTVSAPNSGPL